MQTCIQRMNPNNYYDPYLYSGTAQVKMLTFHTGWIAIVMAVDVHGHC